MAAIHTVLDPLCVATHRSTITIGAGLPVATAQGHITASVRRPLAVITMIVSLIHVAPPRHLRDRAMMITRHLVDRTMKATSSAGRLLLRVTTKIRMFRKADRTVAPREALLPREASMQDTIAALTGRLSLSLFLLVLSPSRFSCFAPV